MNRSKSPRAGGKRTRSVLSAFLLLLVAQSTLASEYGALTEQILFSLVRMEVRLLSDDRDDVADPKQGHGVYISRDGLILTAGHNIFPSTQLFQSSGAATYEIVVFEYDPRLGWLERVAIDGHEIGGLAILDPKFPTARCPGTAEFESLSCLSEQPSDSNAVDLAALKTASRRTSPPRYFVSTMGPWDELADLKSPNLSVVSEFSKKEYPEKIPLYIPAADRQMLVTTTTYSFGPGHSGSPIILYRDSPEVAFVAGVVIRVKKEALQKNTIKIARIDELSSGRVGALIDALDLSKPLSCHRPNLPFERSVLNSYGYLGRRHVNDQEFDAATRCLLKMDGWRDTASIMRKARKRTPELLQLINGFSGSRIDPGRTVCSPDSENNLRCSTKFNISYSSREEDRGYLMAQVDAIVQDLLSKHIKPDKFFGHTRFAFSDSVPAQLLFYNLERSFQEIDRFDYPASVVGGGGYPYGPVVLAAPEFE